MIVMHLDTERTWRGGEQQIHYLIDGLTRRGHRSVLVSPPGSAIASRLQAEKVESYPIEMRGEMDPRAILALAGAIRRVRPDVVHMHTAHAHALGVAAATLAGGVRRVVSRRVDFPVGALSARFKYRWGVDRFIAITHAVAGVLRAAGVGRERIAIVPSGIDPGRLAGADRLRGREALGLAPDDVVVGCVAHFAWHKGLIHLVRAFAGVSAHRPDAVLVLVGDGEDASLLRDAARAVGVESRVRFPGFRRDVPDCLVAFDCFVLPSVLEGLGTSVLDALALEIPVVASRAGGIPEVVTHEETGLLVEPGDERGLAAAIVRMLTDRELARRTAARGRRRVLDHYTADAMVDGTLAVYADVLREAATR